MSDAEVPQPMPVPPPGMPVPVPPRSGNGLATAGFVLGLLGFLGAWIPIVNFVAIALAVIGVVLAAVGLAKSKRTGTGKGLAIAGLILGVLAVIIAIVMTVAVFNAVDDTVNDSTSTSVKPPAGSSTATADGDKATGDKTTGDKASGDKVGTSRDNPAPLGSAITGGDWTVTVNSVKTASEDSLGQKPAAGSTLLLVNLTATYNGDDKQGDSPLVTVGFVTANGTTIDSSDGSTLFIADKEFDLTKTVYAGASVTGNTLIEVPADTWQDGVLSVSPGVLSDDTFVAVK